MLSRNQQTRGVRRSPALTCRSVEERTQPGRSESIKRTLTGGLLALPQVAAWMFTGSVFNLARQRNDVYFEPMWLAVLLIIIVLATGAVFVRGLWLYLKAERTGTMAGAGAVVSMTAAIGLSFVTVVVTFG